MSVSRTGSGAVLSGIQHAWTLPMGRPKHQPLNRTTRIFRRDGSRWRQVHHHGSFEDPALLNRYRQAIN
ncbi:MAG: nuclear transport factor 2 family protein [Bryobacteraceae bacterium]